MTRWRLSALHIGGLVLLLGLIFGLHVRGEWLWDDVYLIQRNPNLEGMAGLRVLVTRDLWGSSGAAPSDLYHPLPMALVWLVTAFGGKSVFALRAVNIALHASVVMLFAAWLRRCGLPRWGVVYISLLFAVHPLVTEPVMWLTGSHDLLATIGCLTALIVWPRAGDGRLHLRVAVAALATAWAALCKEPYFSLPAILALQTVLDRTEPGWKRYAKLLAPTATLLLVVALRHRLGIVTGSGQIGASPLAHLINYATLIGHYFVRSVTFTTAATTEWFRPWQSAAVLAIVAGALGLTAVLILRWRRKLQAAELALFGWGWFLLAIAPHTVSAPVIGMYGNRYAYFPILGLMLMAFSLAIPHADRLSTGPLRALRLLAPVSLCVVGLFTASEANLWRDAAALFGADVDRDPDNPRALYHYGHAVVNKDGCESALPYFVRATQREPTYGRAWHNAAGCLLNLRQYDQALPFAQVAWRLQPRDAGAAYNLGFVRIAQGDRAAGRDLLETALRLDPRHHAAAKMLRELSAAPSGAPERTSP